MLIQRGMPLSQSNQSPRILGGVAVLHLPTRPSKTEHSRAISMSPAHRLNCWTVLHPVALLLILLGLQSRFGDNWRQITWNLSGLSPKRDCSSKRVNTVRIWLTWHTGISLETASYVHILRRFRTHLLTCIVLLYLQYTCCCCCWPRLRTSTRVQLGVCCTESDTTSTSTRYVLL